MKKLTLLLIILIPFLGASQTLPVKTISGIITGNQTWSADTVYLISNDVTLDASATLIIPASTIVKFGYQSNQSYKNRFLVNGTLDVQGTESNPVVFTSERDDSYGGDTNNDGNTTLPAKGDWGYIKFMSTANVSNTFEHCVIRYGGRYYYSNSYNYSIWVVNTNPAYNDATIQNCTIEESYACGIRFDNANSNIFNNTIINSTTYGIYVNGFDSEINGNNIENCGTGIYCIDNGNSSATVLNNNISNSTNAIITDNTGFVSIQNNQITDISGYPFSQYNFSFPNYSGNILTNISLNAIAVKGNISYSNSTTGTWINVQGLNFPYMIIDDLTLSSNVTLSIPASTIVKFGYQSNQSYKNRFLVNGTLDVQGTESNPVVFTSERDDSYGGDTNNDGNTTLPAKGDWGYIKFMSTANVSNTFEHCVIRYGGRYYYSNSYNYSIWVVNTNPAYNDATIQNCTIEESYACGIRFDNANSNIFNNTIINSTTYGIYVNGFDSEINGNNVENCGTGIYCIDNGNSSATVLNNNISNSTNAIITDNTGFVSIQNNQITDISGYPFSQYNFSFPNYSGNILTNISLNAIAVKGNISYSNSTTGTWINVQGLNFPYMIIDDLTLSSNVTLSIPASTIVKFGYQSNQSYKNRFLVNGTLDVQGTESNPVVFTSERDDSYGGDTNNDGNTTLPAKGDWGYIKFMSTANVSNTFEHCVIRYGGRYYYSNSYNYSIWVVNTNPAYNDATIQNCTIEESYACGIRFDNANSNIFNNTIINSTTYGIYVNGFDSEINGNNVENCGTAIYCIDNGTSSASIINNNITNVTNAIITDNTGFVSIQNNQITDISGYPFSQYNFSFPNYSGNILTNISLNAIAVKGNISYSNSTTGTWINVQGLNFPYMIIDDLTLSSNVTLSIPASTIVKFGYQSNQSYKNRFLVNGTLDVQSTESNPVVFTSERDDSYGGDTNNDGNTTLPAKGDWGYIKFMSTANVSNTFEHCVIRYGGRYYYSNSYNYSIWVVNTNPNDDIMIQNCELSHFYQYGIYYDNGQVPLNISNTTFIDGSIGIQVSNSTGTPATTIEGCYFSEISDKAIYGLNNSMVLRDNTFFGNKYGIYLKGGDTQKIENSIFNNSSTTAVYIDGNASEPLIIINGNVIKNSTAYHIHAVNYANADNNIINAEGNYFDEPDSTSLATMVYDYNDNTGSPHIDFMPFFPAGDINPVCIADFDFSGRVDGFDLAVLANSFGASLGDTYYNAITDLDNSNRVDGLDLAYFGLRYGSAGPCDPLSGSKNYYPEYEPEILINVYHVSDNIYKAVINVESFNEVFGGNIQLSKVNNFEVTSVSFIDETVSQNSTMLFDQNENSFDIGFYSNITFSEGNYLEIIIESETLVNQIDISTIQLIDMNENLLLNLTSSIDEMNNADELFTCYPNPFDTEIILQINSKNAGRITITDIQGRVIDEISIYPEQKTYYNTEKISNGIYFINYTSEGISKTIKTIKF